MNAVRRRTESFWSGYSSRDLETTREDVRSRSRNGATENKTTCFSRGRGDFRVLSVVSRISCGNSRYSFTVRTCGVGHDTDGQKEQTTATAAIDHSSAHTCACAYVDCLGTTLKRDLEISTFTRPPRRTPIVPRVSRSSHLSSSVFCVSRIHVVRHAFYTTAEDSAAEPRRFDERSKRT